MLNLFRTIALVLAAAVLFPAVGYAGECPGTYNVRTWTNCIGSYTNVYGRIYVGEFKDGNMDGQGTYTKASGNKYVGTLKDNMKNGQGTRTLSDGRVEEGVWKDDKFLYAQKVTPIVTAKKSPAPSLGDIQSNLPKCEGSPRRGDLSGEEYILSTLSRSWDNCFGTITYADGKKYVGEFRDDEFKQGTFTYADGTKYVGEFKFSEPHGQGTYTDADGEKYVGKFKDDNHDGQVNFTFADGRVIKGIFKKGKVKYAQKITPTVTAKKSSEPSDEVLKENERLRKKIARLEKEKKQKPKAKPKQVAKKKPEPKVVVTKSSKPSVLQFRKSPKRPDDVAVIIGNADYKTQGKDIPNVVPAYADAASIKNYVTQALGIAEDNIIYLKDATQTDLVGTFGNKDNHKGRLFRYLTQNKSNVFVFYSGHGAPGDDDTNYLVPTDAEASLIDLNGYSLKTLYQNLSKLPAKSVTVVLEACFSGASEAGTVINNASPVYLKAKDTGIPSNITVIAAGAANQIASWETDKSHGLFTKYFLKGMSGEADNDNDQKVSWDELRIYLAKTVTRSAMRNYGREQTPQIVVGK